MSEADLFTDGWRRTFLERPASGALACAVVGYTVFLYVWLGDIGKGAGPELTPFRGLVGPDWALERQGIAFVSVAVPALIVSGIVVAPLRAGFRRIEFAFLLANVLFFVVLLGRLSYRDGYTSMARVTSGIVVAAVVGLPWLWSRPECPLSSRRVVRPLVLDAARHRRLRLSRLIPG